MSLVDNLIGFVGRKITFVADSTGCAGYDEGERSAVLSPELSSGDPVSLVVEIKLKSSSLN